MRPYARFTLFLLVLTAALVWIAWGGAAAQTGDSSTAQFNRGILLYQRYCSNCHGDQAHGDGRIAHLLKTEPADLTQLTDEDGRFPTDEVRKTIDGRAGILAHGTREMPIWGQVFLEGDGPEAEAEVEAKIDDLIGYLEAIQEE